MGIISIIVLGIGIYKLVGIYKERECEEENLVLKIFGYYFLGSFRFSFNWLSIPLGYIIYLTSFKPSINKNIKRVSANLGLIMFCLGIIIPIAQTSIYERSIYIQSEPKEISSINFIDDLNIIRDEFDMQKSVSIE